MAIVDIYLLYQFLRRLTTPFDEWDAYDLGIIDKDGKVLKKRKTLKTSKEKRAFGLFDVLVMNLKKLLAKIPGGRRRIATYAAALLLLKEQNATDQRLSYLVENIDDALQQNLNEVEEYDMGFLDYLEEADNKKGYKVGDKVKYKNIKSKRIRSGRIKKILSNGMVKKFELDNSQIIYPGDIVEEAPTNSAGSGSVDGIGVGADGEPGVSTKNKYKKKNEKDGKAILRRVQQRLKSNTEVSEERTSLNEAIKVGDVVTPKVGRYQGLKHQVVDIKGDLYRTIPIFDGKKIDPRKYKKGPSNISWEKAPGVFKKGQIKKAPYARPRRAPDSRSAPQGGRPRRK